MKQLMVFLAMMTPVLVFGQKGYIIYRNVTNGKEAPFKNVLLFDNGIAQPQASGNSKELSFINYNKKQTEQFVNNKGEYLAFASPFKDNPTLKKSDITETICGVTCKKATFIANSNTIDIFYNENQKIKGSPAINYLPQLGTVLKVIVNGNRVTEAIEMKEGSYEGKKLTVPTATSFLKSQAAFTRALIDSRFTTLSIFKNDTINFSDKYPKVYPEKYDETYHYGMGNILLKKIKLPEFRKNEGIFITVTQRSNGDAYDRTGCVFVIPVAEGEPLIRAYQQNSLTGLPSYSARNGKDYKAMVSQKGFTVPFELMRFFTPFGVGAYNTQSQIAGYHWPDSASYSQDISDLKSALSGKEVYIMMSIGNYNAGHIASLDLKIYPGSDDKNVIAGGNNFFKMLFNTTNVAETIGQSVGDMFDQDSLKVNFTLEQPLKNAYLRYVSTGWGGWGNGDEFLPKINTLFLNDEKVFSFIPWRSDCVTYRNLNPVSGNFGNGLSSSDLSRSNWCPGTTTNPIYIPLGNLKAGNHELKVAIPMGKPEGSSYSGWNLSGLLMGITE